MKLAYSAFDKLETDFEKNFLERALAEVCFFRETGIKTNYVCIPKFIELKDRLGPDWNWEKIGEMLSYLDLSSEKITIRLSKQKKICTITILVFFLISALFGLFFIFIYSDYSKTHTIIQYLTALLLFILQVFVGYLWLRSKFGSVLTAMIMEKRLNKSQNGLNKFQFRLSNMLLVQEG